MNCRFQWCNKCQMALFTNALEIVVVDSVKQWSEKCFDFLIGTWGISYFLFAWRSKLNENDFSFSEQDFKSIEARELISFRWWLWWMIIVHPLSGLETTFIIKVITIGSRSLLDECTLNSKIEVSLKTTVREVCSLCCWCKHFVTCSAQRLNQQRFSRNLQRAIEERML